MSTLRALLAKDVRRRLADPAGLLLNLAIPVALAGMMALAFGNLGGGKPRAPVLKALVADLDDTPLTTIMAGSSQNKEAAERLNVVRVATREEGLLRLRNNEAAALLVIPKGFSDDVLDGRPATVELVKNPAQSIMPVVADEGAKVAALWASTLLRVLGDDRARLRELMEGRGWDDAAGVAALVTSTYVRVKSADTLLFPPLIEVEDASAPAGADDGSGSGFDLMSFMYPGLVVMGVLFVGTLQMRDLLRERDAGTLKRMLSTPASAAIVLLSKVLAVAVIVGVAYLILVAFGSLAFGLSWGPPLPFLATSLLLVTTATGFAAVIYAVVKTERQGDAFGGILVMVMSILGGAFIPPQVMPESVRGISRLTVNYWGQEALRALTGGGGWPQIGQHLTVLAALSVGFIAVGAALLNRRHVRGAL